jgi:hypothetical protein
MLLENKARLLLILPQDALDQARVSQTLRFRIWAGRERSTCVTTSGVDGAWRPR